MPAIVPRASRWLEIARRLGDGPRTRRAAALMVHPAPNCVRGPAGPQVSAGIDIAQRSARAPR